MPVQLRRELNEGAVKAVAKITIELTGDRENYARVRFRPDWYCVFGDFEFSAGFGDDDGWKCNMGDGGLHKLFRWAKDNAYWDEQEQ